MDTHGRFLTNTWCMWHKLSVMGATARITFLVYFTINIKTNPGALKILKFSKTRPSSVQWSSAAYKNLEVNQYFFPHHLYHWKALVTKRLQKAPQSPQTSPQMLGMRSRLYSLHKRKEVKTFPVPGISRPSRSCKKAEAVASARTNISLQEGLSFLLPLPLPGSVTWGNSLNFLVAQSALLQNKERAGLLLLVPGNGQGGVG